MAKAMPVLISLYKEQAKLFGNICYIIPIIRTSPLFNVIWV